MTTKARPDADRNEAWHAEHQARLGANRAEWLRERGFEVRGPLLSAVLSALRAIGSQGGAEEHADGSVWIDSLYVEADCDCFYVMREIVIAGGAHSDQCGPGFVRERGDAWAMRQAASALVREWVREQLDCWVSDDGGGE